MDEELKSVDGLLPIDIATSTGNLDVMDAMLSPTPLMPSPIGTSIAKRWEQGGKGNVFKGLDRLTHALSKERLAAALCAAARYGHTNCIARLVGAYRCSVVVVDGRGNTPLHLAIMNIKSRAVHMLKKYGVPQNVRNRDGWTALEMAVQRMEAEERGGEGAGGGRRMVEILQSPSLS